MMMNETNAIKFKKPSPSFFVHQSRLQFLASAGNLITGGFMPEPNLDRFSRGANYESKDNSYDDCMEYHADIQRQIQLMDELISELNTIDSIAWKADRYFTWLEKRALKMKLKIMKQKINEMKKSIDDSEVCDG